MATLNLDAKKKVRNAQRPLELVITKEHVKRATCKDPTKCVIAQALHDSPVGEFAESFMVGPSCTKIVFAKEIWRYKTPARLRNALSTFDETGQWYLPPGTYKLMPYTAAQRRWESAKRLGGKQSKFKRVVSAPTRVTLTIHQLKGETEKK